MTVTIARARRDDAFACAALRLQMDLEAGEANRSGFITEYADYFLAHYELLPTWIASSANGAALGMVMTNLSARPPGLSAPGQTALSINTVFVTQQARGNGLEERLLLALKAWCETSGIARIRSAVEPGMASVPHAASPAMSDESGGS